MTPTYRVFSRLNCAFRKSFYVITGEGDKEYVVTKFTGDRATAQRWCDHLNRAAQIEVGRKREAKGLRR